MSSVTYRICRDEYHLQTCFEITAISLNTCMIITARTEGSAFITPTVRAIAEIKAPKLGIVSHCYGLWSEQDTRKTFSKTIE